MRSRAQIAADIAAQEKTCPKCEQRKPFSAFTKCSSYPDGIWVVCRLCKADYDRRLRGDGPKRLKTRFGDQIAADIASGSKCCTKCGERKPFDDFNRSTRSSDGHQPKCRACHKSPHAAYRARTPAELRHDLETQAKRCGRCDTRKPFDAFQLRKASLDGRSPWCAVCTTAYRSNKDRQFQWNHARRTRRLAAEGFATHQQIAWRRAMWGGRCYECQKPATSVDHYKPLSRGGSNWPANLRPICASCNGRKSNRWPWPTTMIGVWGVSLTPILDERAA